MDPTVELTLKDMQGSSHPWPCSNLVPTKMKTVRACDLDPCPMPVVYLQPRAEIVIRLALEACKTRGKICPRKTRVEPAQHERLVIHPYQLSISTSPTWWSSGYTM